jgi:dehydrogenase/reductase SDR family member 12
MLLRLFASFLFYSRFLFRFSRLGLRQRAKSYAPVQYNFQGQVWLVTGASAGIGAAIALLANAHGATVIAAARDIQKLQALQKRAKHPHQLLPAVIDFSDLESVQHWLATQKNLSIDVLVNNVGNLLNTYQLTPAGLERSLVTNLLSHVQLTDALVAHGRFSTGAAVINMSSGGMYGMPIRIEELFALEKDYEGMAAYAMHKRSQVAMTGVWNQEWQAANKKANAYVMHPGWVDTPGVRMSLPWFRAILRWFLRNEEQGADTALWLAQTRPDPVEGIWLDRVVDPIHVFDVSRKSKASAEELAVRLRNEIINRKV